MSRGEQSETCSVSVILARWKEVHVVSMVVLDTFKDRVEDRQNDDTEDSDSEHRNGRGNEDITNSKHNEERESEESESVDLSR